MSLPLAIVFAAMLSGPSGGPSERCELIRMSDGEGPSFEQQLSTAESEVLEALLARIVDRLESFACYERSEQLLAKLQTRLDELMFEDEGRQDSLRAKLELVRLRVDTHRRCPELDCEAECGAVEALAGYVDAHPELERDTIETWLLADQNPSESEALTCLLERAAEAKSVPPPLLLPDTPSAATHGSGLGPSPHPGGQWTPSDRRRAIVLSSLGLGLGLTTLIVGGVLLAIDENCPGGAAPNQCELRYSTTDEGILALSVGGVALIGSTVGLTMSLQAKPSSQTKPSSQVRPGGWAFNVGWTGRF